VALLPGAQLPERDDRIPSAARLTPPLAADSRSPRILVAPDSFKGSLSQAEVAAAIAEGVMRALPSAQVTELPLSDGGEGWLDTLVDADPGGRTVSAAVRGPLGEEIDGR